MLTSALQYPELLKDILLVILSFTLFIVCIHDAIPRTPVIVSIIVTIIMVYFFGMAPATEDIGLDRLNYEDMFLNADSYIQDGMRDTLFFIYAGACFGLCGNTTGCFIISAFLYVFAYLYFYKKACPTKHFYLLLIGSLALGYTAYHYNVLRAGLAIACMLVAMSKGQNKYVTIGFTVLAMGIHLTSGVIALGYIVASKYSKTKYYYVFWVLMLLCLLIGVFNSLSNIVTPLSTIGGGRFEGYLTRESSYYKAGLRLDFIVYSLIPIVAGWYYIFRRNFQDKYYIKLYHTYVFCNACWLMFNKIPYTDRIAYLSWFLIPILLLYPLLSNKVIPHKKTLFLISALLVVGIALYI